MLQLIIFFDHYPSILVTYLGQGEHFLEPFSGEAKA